MELRERVKPGLKDKLRAHYQTKDQIFQPDPQNANTFGVGFFMYMSFVLLGESLFILLPDLFEEGSHWKILITVLILFIFVEAMINWIMSRKKASVVVAEMRNKAAAGDNVETPAGWKNCFRCQMDAPPRSHHCNLCGVCVLKRDHHCFFTASCVGFFNQRRFIVLLFYTTMANTIAIALQLMFLDKVMPILSWQFINYFPPMTAYKWLIAGEVPFTLLFVVIHLYLAAFCLAGAVFFLVWQLVIVTRGQTSHEAWKNIDIYRTGVLEGWRSTFGPYGILHFLFPFQIDLDEDGITWKMSNKGY